MSTPSTNSKSKTKSILDSIRSSKTLTPLSSQSFFSKSVNLEDWWVMMAQDKSLAVGGYSSREMQGARLFFSAAISTRHDTTTLETTDGFTISISGFINRPRTCENGFPSEVCNRFLLGFPYDWEGYAARCFGGKYNGQCVSKKCSASDDTSPPISLDDILVTRIRDLYMSTLDYSGNWALSETIFEDLIKKMGEEESCKNKGSLFDLETDGIGSIVDHSYKRKKAKVDKNKKIYKILNSTNTKTEKHKSNVSQSKKVWMDSVATRSMMKRTRSQNNPEKSSVKYFNRN